MNNSLKHGQTPRRPLIASAQALRAIAVALVAALCSAPALAAEREGTVDIIDADKQMLIVNDAEYIVSPSVIVTYKKRKTTNWQRVIKVGQYVRANVKGEGGTSLGTITEIQVLPGRPAASPE